MLEIVSFKWGNRYTVGHINALYRGVCRHYAKPFRFTAISNEAMGLDEGIRVLSLWDDHAAVPNPQGAHKPSCYRRLKLFAPEARELIGERIVCLDLDTVICGDLAPLWDRPEPVVFYKGQWGVRIKSKQPYCGAMFMLTAGARPQVWEKFNPATSPRAAYEAGYRGSDQGWFGFVLGDREAVWDANDGIYCWRNMYDQTKMPAGARMICFNGKVKPWDVTHVAWVKENYAKAAA